MIKTVCPEWSILTVPAILRLLTLPSLCSTEHWLGEILREAYHIPYLEILSRYLHLKGFEKACINDTGTAWFSSTISHEAIFFLFLEITINSLWN